MGCGLLTNNIILKEELSYYLTPEDISKYSSYLRNDIEYFNVVQHKHMQRKINESRVCIGALCLSSMIKLQMESLMQNTPAATTSIHLADEIMTFLSDELEDYKEYDMAPYIKDLKLSMYDLNIELRRVSLLIYKYGWQNLKNINCVAIASSAVKSVMESIIDVFSMAVRLLIKIYPACVYTIPDQFAQQVSKVLMFSNSAEEACGIIAYKLFDKNVMEEPTAFINVNLIRELIPTYRNAVAMGNTNLMWKTIERECGVQQFMKTSDLD